MAHNFFSTDHEGYTDTHETAAEAKKAAEDNLQHCREMASEGWSEETHRIMWGEIRESAKIVRRWKPKPEDNPEDFAEFIDYGLVACVVGMQRFRELHAMQVAQGVGVHDWLASLRSELAELGAATSPEAVRDEYGDVLYNAIFLGLSLGFDDPMAVAEESFQKVVARMAWVTLRKDQDGFRAQFDRLWEASKRADNKPDGDKALAEWAKERGTEAKAKAKAVIVCDACRMASCWHGVHMCQQSDHAGTIEVSVATLAEEAREHPENWDICENHGVARVGCGCAATLDETSGDA